MKSRSRLLSLCIPMGQRNNGRGIMKSAHPLFKKKKKVTGVIFAGVFGCLVERNTRAPEFLLIAFCLPHSCGPLALGRRGSVSSGVSLATWAAIFF